MKYPSLTTPDIEHDAANLLAEFIWLNQDIRADTYPWRGNNGKAWGKLVAALKKLMREPYGLSAGQLAFYIWKCKPRRIDPAQFAKMAVVARRLFENYDLEQVSRFYTDWQKELASSGLEKVKYKEKQPKTLLSFLRELERGQA
ncbi:MAG: hypothetical protein K5880_14090 [Hydrogenophaga sp.]|uniref:hypothetical protein n=1 Tax=Hydrogenophaga sp. TaxID=1904254 RepID=UPI00261A2181|nr:hypothetical protein [Hydrogenophaga sp.]MCV0439753.1 hypothetical protein [Hydrogenophaga sp.]